MITNSASEQAQEKLLKANDIAEVLNISRALSYRLLQDGDIPAIRIRNVLRVMPKDLEEYIQKCRTSSSGEALKHHI